jgi:hypothetical protein
VKWYAYDDGSNKVAVADSLNELRPKVKALAHGSLLKATPIEPGWWQYEFGSPTPHVMPVETYHLVREDQSETVLDHLSQSGGQQ